MIIPIKCFTCGKVLGDLYEFYKCKVIDEKFKKIKSTSSTSVDIENTEYFTKQNVDKSVEGHILDSLNVKRHCCRINMLTHVDIE